MRKSTPRGAPSYRAPKARSKPPGKGTAKGNSGSWTCWMPSGLSSRRRACILTPSPHTTGGSPTWKGSPEKDSIREIHHHSEVRTDDHGAENDGDNRCGRPCRGGLGTRCPQIFPSETRSPDRRFRGTDTWKGRGAPGEWRARRT